MRAAKYARAGIANSPALADLSHCTQLCLKVSTTCGSGWVGYTDPKSLAVLHTDHRATRYRRWVLTSSKPDQ